MCAYVWCMCVRRERERERGIQHKLIIKAVPAKGYKELSAMSLS